MGLYYIYDNDYFESQQFVRDIKREIYLPANNEYVKQNADNSFVQMTDNFVPKNKQDLLNIYFTVLNSGWDQFTFYCDYETCLDDINEISTNTVLLSNLNSFISPYNQYNTISTYTTPFLNAKVTLIVEKTYSDQEIIALNERINEIYNGLKLDKYSTKEKIRSIHDYIIKHARYDALKIDNINDDTYKSSTAYGAIFEGYAVCSGYSDAMAIFLDKLGIPNMKVASNTHVWNLVYLNNEWHHLDLTWDDPYSPNGKDTLNYRFFLIDYDSLKKQDTTEHNFDHNVYKEAL